MGIFKIIRNTDDGLKYMHNALNYVIGTHTDYDKRYSPNVDIYNACEQFSLVKNTLEKQVVILYFILLLCMMQNQPGGILMKELNL